MGGCHRVGVHVAHIQRSKRPHQSVGCGRGPYAVVQQLNFYIFGASVISFAIGLLAWSDRGWRLLIGVPLVVFGIGVILAGFVQFDPNYLKATTTRYHINISLVTFLTAIPAISITSWGLNHASR